MIVHTQNLCDAGAGATSGTQGPHICAWKWLSMRGGARPEGGAPAQAVHRPPAKVRVQQGDRQPKVADLGYVTRVLGGRVQICHSKVGVSGSAKTSKVITILRQRWGGLGWCLSPGDFRVRQAILEKVWSVTAEAQILKHTPV